MDEPSKFKMGHVTQPRLFQGRCVILRPGIATINLCAKFEISTFTHYEDMKCDEK